MQLAKNLYLSRTKTLSRKLQEAALTMLLEQNFSKRELLELYLNVVEFGPGIYGIGPAAAYYFGKPARDLSPAQAFFIASVLPSPTVRHFDEQGNLSASRLRHVHSLLRISHERGRLSADELAQALAEVPHFGVSESQPPAPSEISAPKPGEETRLP
jgi:penicillin-binding protein 1A